MPAISPAQNKTPSRAKSLPDWNEEIIYESITYTMDSSNGELYDPKNGMHVGTWEANYEYSVPDNCEGIVTWVDDKAEENHTEKVSQKEADPESASALWPEASKAMINGDFRGAGGLFRTAFQESRGWNNLSEEPYTLHEQLLLTLILICETHVNR
jgi:hypothetical protein